MSIKPVFDPDLPVIADYRQLFRDDVPMIDVRAPIEFEQGAFPTAENQPLMNDQERHEIGIRYAQAGQESAIALGRELVDTRTEAERTQGWQAFYQQHPNAVLYCFRGGLRSKISQQWLCEHSGMRIPRVAGGYKALRRYLIDELEQSITGIDPVVIAGRTGSAKTDLVNAFSAGVDLEGLANHMGSAFGSGFAPQPTQINFENALSIALIKQIDAGRTRLLLEDEGRRIGARSLPKSLHEVMRDAPIVLIEESIESRVSHLLSDYISKALKPFQQALGEAAGFDAWMARIHENLDKIQKRLGGQRYKELKAMATQAEQAHRESGDMEAHRDWVSRLMVEYYDPMYDYQLSSSKRPILFRGSWQASYEFLTETLSQS